MFTVRLDKAVPNDSDSDSEGVAGEKKETLKFDYITEVSLQMSNPTFSAI